MYFLRLHGNLFLSRTKSNIACKWKNFFLCHCLKKTFDTKKELSNSTFSIFCFFFFASRKLEPTNYSQLSLQFLLYCQLPALTLTYILETFYDGKLLFFSFICLALESFHVILWFIWWALIGFLKLGEINMSTTHVKHRTLHIKNSSRLNRLIILYKFLLNYKSTEKLAENIYLEDYHVTWQQKCNQDHKIEIKFQFQ